MTSLNILKSYHGKQFQYNHNNCSLIVDPNTYREIKNILLSVNSLQMYELSTSSDESDIINRDISEIVDIINHAIQNGLIPYYWSKTKNIYLPINRALGIEKYNPGISLKHTTYYLVILILGVERKISIYDICPIDQLGL